MATVIIIVAVPMGIMVSANADRDGEKEFWTAPRDAKVQQIQMQASLAC